MKKIVLYIFFSLVGFIAIAQNPITITYDFDDTFEAKMDINDKNIIYPQRALIGGPKLVNQGLESANGSQVAVTQITNNNATNYQQTFFRFDLHTVRGVKFKINKVRIVQKSDHAGDPDLIDEEGNGDTYMFRIGTQLNGAIPNNNDRNQSTINTLFSDEFEETEYTPGEGYNYVQNEDYISVFVTGKGENNTNDVFNWYVDKVVIEGEYVKGLDLPTFTVDYAMNDKDMSAVSSNPNVSGTEIARQQGDSQWKQTNTFSVRLKTTDNNLGFSYSNRVGLFYSLTTASGYKTLVHNYQYKIAGSGQHGKSRAHRTAVYRDKTRDDAGVKVADSHFEFNNIVLTGVDVYGDNVKDIDYVPVFFKDDLVFEDSYAFVHAINRTGKTDNANQKEYLTFDHITIRGTVVPENAYALVQELLTGQELYVNAIVGEGDTEYQQEIVDRYILELQSHVDFAFDESKSVDELNDMKTYIEVINDHFRNNTNSRSINTAPTVIARTEEVTQDGILTITLNGDDDDGDLLTYGISTAPSNGTVEIINDQLVYTPTRNFYGSDELEYIARDGRENSTPAKIAITVTSSGNLAPDAESATYKVTEGDELSITLKGSDGDGDPITFMLESQPQYGTLSGTAPDLVYTHNEGYLGEDSFTFKTTDGIGFSELATISITVQKRNTKPEVDDMAKWLYQDATVNITLTGTDFDGQDLSYSITDQPKHGTISGTAPNIVYTPEAGYFGEDTLKFIVNDGIDDSDEATVSILVVQVEGDNSAPIVENMSKEVYATETLEFTLTAQDAENDLLSFYIISNVSDGELSINDGVVTYIPSGNYLGEVSFQYVANDGELDSNIGTVTINVKEDTPTNIEKNLNTKLEVKLTSLGIRLFDKSQARQDLDIVMLNTQGQILLQDNITLLSNSSQFIDYRSTKGVLYILKIQSKDGVLLQKLILN
ncbi:Ig-like domain-containing protein [Flammeovirga agarivorans]|uniref:Tandem-95 repeat protein n=1 Tax=Flammeovirga agarivorans TaxID=2726742 RepID=A0A7X8XXW9_9BACT|nr:Ig-like domain-containing protein [Flammeovirga agarivorans]NLR93470.1 tandem-95 repeat protein [Flammeovirga agarivorans]